ncbi:hypothetical protein HQQ94_15055 [Shewanella sp. VB17]|uniref:hypothetical protein n=1 Tax=Shewanella sp. VB17 TaxID=2739432 RepID=UPI001564B13F|nr:hypothetical protein [Shewanella sp. VB17]NRD74532.1 hypothetical protein [Shewanella sp. VB17]
MSRITQLEDDIKIGCKNNNEYKIQLNAIRDKVYALKVSDRKCLLDAVDSAEEVIETLFHRYK